jgi:hypothetical protein
MGIAKQSLTFFVLYEMALFLQDSTALNAPAIEGVLKISPEHISKHFV